MGTQGEGRRGPARRASDAKRPSVLVLGDVPPGWDEQLAAFYDLTFTSEQSDCIALAESSHPDAIIVCSLADESTLLLEILSSSQETEGIPSPDFSTGGRSSSAWKKRWRARDGTRVRCRSSC